MSTNYRRIWAYFNHDANDIPEYYGMGTSAPQLYNSGWIRYGQYLQNLFESRGFNAVHIHNPFGRGGLGSRTPNVYNPNIAYASGQVVRNLYPSGIFSISKINNNLGNTPTGVGSTAFWQVTGIFPNAYLYNSGVTYCTGAVITTSNGSSWVSLRGNNSGNSVTDSNWWAPFDQIGYMLFDTVQQRYNYGDLFTVNNFVNAWRNFGRRFPLKAYIGTQHYNTRFSDLLLEPYPNFTKYDTKMHNSMQLLLACNMHITFDAASLTASGDPFNHYMRYLKQMGVNVGVESLYSNSSTWLDGYDVVIAGHSIQGVRNGIIAGSFRPTGFCNEVVVTLDYQPNYAKVYAGAWATSTLYRGTGNLAGGTGNAVLHNNQYYFCTSGHTSAASTEPGVGVAASSVWATGYFDYVAYNGLWVDNQITGFVSSWINNMFTHGFSVAIGASAFSATNPVQQFIPSGWTYVPSYFGYTGGGGVSMP